MKLPIEEIAAELIRDGDHISIRGSKLFHTLSDRRVTIVVVTAQGLERHIEIRQENGSALYLRRDELVLLTWRQGRLF